MYLQKVWVYTSDDGVIMGVYEKPNKARQAIEKNVKLDYVKKYSWGSEETGLFGITGVGDVIRMRVEW
jgi:hypothetical protein